jgi:hypothetical protein
MLVLISLVGILVLIIIVCIVLQFAFYYIYPDWTVDNLISNTALVNKINAGRAGQAGDHGGGDPLDFAMSGVTGPRGDIAPHGDHGTTFLETGLKGFKGRRGDIGPYGSFGNPGVAGLPSNAMVPYLIRNHDNIQHIAPHTIEHGFTYNDVFYKLTGSFIFDDLNYFSFANGLGNKRFHIVQDPLFVPIGTTGPGITPSFNSTTTAKKINASLRVVLERKSSKSEGSESTVFYTSPPINKTGYLIVSDVNLIQKYTTTDHIEEITIDSHREFGLDFEIQQDDSLLFNYLIGGLLRYRAIFNIEPPNDDLVPRLEERYSNTDILDNVVPSYTLDAKGSIRKISDILFNGPGHTGSGPTGTTGPANDIYMLSPRLVPGKVVYKNSADSKNVWLTQDFTSLADSLIGNGSDLIEAFNDLTADMLSFKGELEKAKTEVAFERFEGIETQNNIAIGSKRGHIGTTGPYGHFTNTDLFQTKMSMTKLTLQHPNTDSNLSYPSTLEKSTMYLKFIVKINIKDIDKLKYYVYLVNLPGPDHGPVVVDTNTNTVFYSRDARLGNTATENIEFPSTTDITKFSLPVNYEAFNLYYSVVVDSLEFSKFFGRRMICNFSNSKMHFDSRFVSDTHPDGWDPAFIPYDRQNGMINATLFEGDSTEYDFIASMTDDVRGFDMTFESSKYTVEENTFVVGYKIGNTVKYQRVNGFRKTNGDYYLDVPSNGYNLELILP